MKIEGNIEALAKCLFQKGGVDVEKELKEFEETLEKIEIFLEGNEIAAKTIFLKQLGEIESLIKRIDAFMLNCLIGKRSFPQAFSIAKFYLRATLLRLYPHCIPLQEDGYLSYYRNSKIIISECKLYAAKQGYKFFKFNNPIFLQAFLSSISCLFLVFNYTVLKKIKNYEIAEDIISFPEKFLEFSHKNIGGDSFVIIYSDVEEFYFSKYFIESDFFSKAFIPMIDRLAYCKRYDVGIFDAIEGEDKHILFYVASFSRWLQANFFIETKGIGFQQGKEGFFSKKTMEIIGHNEKVKEFFFKIKSAYSLDLEKKIDEFIYFLECNFKTSDLFQRSVSFLKHLIFLLEFSCVLNSVHYFLGEESFIKKTDSLYSFRHFSVRLKKILLLSVGFGHASEGSVDKKIAFLEKTEKSIFKSFGENKKIIFESALLVENFKKNIFSELDIRPIYKKIIFDFEKTKIEEIDLKSYFYFFKAINLFLSNIDISNIFHINVESDYCLSFRYGLNGFLRIKDFLRNDFAVCEELVLFFFIGFKKKFSEVIFLQKKSDLAKNAFIKNRMGALISENIFFIKELLKNYISFYEILFEGKSPSLSQYTASIAEECFDFEKIYLSQYLCSSFLFGKAIDALVFSKDLLFSLRKVSYQLAIFHSNLLCEFKDVNYLEPECLKKHIDSKNFLVLLLSFSRALKIKISEYEKPFLKKSYERIFSFLAVFSIFLNCLPVTKTPETKEGLKRIFLAFLSISRRKPLFDILYFPHRDEADGERKNFESLVRKNLIILCRLDKNKLQEAIREVLARSCFAASFDRKAEIVFPGSSIALMLKEPMLVVFPFLSVVKSMLLGMPRSLQSHHEEVGSITEVTEGDVKYLLNNVFLGMHAGCFIESEKLIGTEISLIDKGRRNVNLLRLMWPSIFEKKKMFSLLKKDITVTNLLAFKLRTFLEAKYFFEYFNGENCFPEDFQLFLKQFLSNWISASSFFRKDDVFQWYVFIYFSLAILFYKTCESRLQSIFCYDFFSFLRCAKIFLSSLEKSRALLAVLFSRMLSFLYYSERVDCKTNRQFLNKEAKDFFIKNVIFFMGDIESFHSRPELFWFFNTVGRFLPFEDFLSMQKDFSSTPRQFDYFSKIFPPIELSACEVNLPIFLEWSHFIFLFNCSVEGGRKLQTEKMGLLFFSEARKALCFLEEIRNLNQNNFIWKKCFLVYSTILREVFLHMALGESDNDFFESVNIDLESFISREVLSIKAGIIPDDSLFLNSIFHFFTRELGLKKRNAIRADGLRRSAEAFFLKLSDEKKYSLSQQIMPSFIFAMITSYVGADCFAEALLWVDRAIQCAFFQRDRNQEIMKMNALVLKARFQFMLKNQVDMVLLLESVGQLGSFFKKEKIFSFFYRVLNYDSAALFSFENIFSPQTNAFFSPKFFMENFCFCLEDLETAIRKIIFWGRRGDLLRTPLFCMSHLSTFAQCLHLYRKILKVSALLPGSFWMGIVRPVICLPSEEIELFLEEIMQMLAKPASLAENPAAYFSHKQSIEPVFPFPPVEEVVAFIEQSAETVNPTPKKTKKSKKKKKADVSKAVVVAVQIPPESMPPIVHGKQPKKAVMALEKKEPRVELLLPEWVEEIVQVLQVDGISVWLTGGTIRDHLLGLHDFHDIDLICDTTFEAIFHAFKKHARFGRALTQVLPHIPRPAYGLEILLVGTYGMPHIVINGLPAKVNISIFQAVTMKEKSVTLTLSNGNQALFYPCRAVDESHRLKEQADRADFTCNALFFCFRTKKIIDLLDGQVAIQAKLLCPVLPEGMKMTDFFANPRHVMRTLRFLIQLSFQLESSAIENLLTAHINRFPDLPLEQRGTLNFGWERLFSVKNPGEVYDFLKQKNWLQSLFLLPLTVSLDENNMIAWRRGIKKLRPSMLLEKRAVFWASLLWLPSKYCPVEELKAILNGRHFGFRDLSLWPMICDELAAMDAVLIQKQPTSALPSPQGSPACEDSCRMSPFVVKQ